MELKEIEMSASLGIFISDKATYETPGINNSIDADKASFVESEIEIAFSADDIIYWGDNNNNPEEWEKEIRKNVDLTRALGILIRFLLAGGITYKVYNRKTKIISEEIIPEIDTLIKKSYQYPLIATTNLYRYFNFFPELILDKKQEKVSRIACLNSKYFRFKTRSNKGKRKNQLTKGVYQGDWIGGAMSEGKSEVLDVIDPLFYEPELLSQILKERNIKKFVFPQSFYTGNTNYQWPEWVSIITSAWLKLVNEIPKFKAAVMRNQITLKYHIRMPDYWMADKYKAWLTYTDDKRRELIKNETQKFENFLSTSENSGKSIVSMFKTDRASGKPWPGWEVIAIDDKMKDGLYIEDGVEGSIKIYTAVGVDPAIMGILPGKNAANRSGSERREAFNLHQSVITTERSLILKPYDIASDLNGWNNEEQLILWSIKTPQLQILNEVTPSKRETKIDQDEL